MSVWACLCVSVCVRLVLLQKVTFFALPLKSALCKRSGKLADRHAQASSMVLGSINQDPASTMREVVEFTCSNGPAGVGGILLSALHRVLPDDFKMVLSKINGARLRSPETPR